MGLKELAYRAATTPPARALLTQLGRLVDVPGLEAPDREASRSGTMKLCVTIDTEGGYVDDDERRIWQGRAPNALQGYVHGLPNLARVLDRHGVKATFLVAPHGATAVKGLLRSFERAGHEIGLHLHPSSDCAIAKRLGRTFHEGSARRLPIDDQRILVGAGKTILEELLGSELTSFRWGNWALDERAAAIVAEAGFRIDSSAVPRIGDGRRYDWTSCSERAPWEIAPGLHEIPIATFRWFGRWLRADPLYGPLLDAAFDRYRARASYPFVVMTHSCEATHRDGSPTKVLADLDRFLGHALRFAEAVPLREAWRTDRPSDHGR